MADGAGGGGKRRESIDAIRRQCQRRDAERPTRRRIQYPLMYIFSIFLPFFFFFIIFSSSSSSSSSDTGIRLDGDKCSGRLQWRRHCFPFDLGLLVAVPFPRRQQQQQQKEKNPFARGDGTAKAKRPSWRTVVERSDWMTEPRNWNQHASTPKGRASSALIGLEKSKEKPRCVHPERRT